MVSRKRRRPGPMPATSHSMRTGRGGSIRCDPSIRREDRMTKAATVVALLLLLAATPACADNCDKSRTYLLGGLGGDLMRPPSDYDNLFKQCVATASMPNVRDAYI